MKQPVQALSPLLLKFLAMDSWNFPSVRFLAVLIMTPSIKITLLLLTLSVLPSSQPSHCGERDTGRSVTSFHDYNVSSYVTNIGQRRKSTLNIHGIPLMSLPVRWCFHSSKTLGIMMQSGLTAACFPKESVLERLFFSQTLDLVHFFSFNGSS